MIDARTLVSVNRSATANRDAVLACIVVALVGLISLRFPRFAAPGNLAELLDDTAILIVLALGQMLLLLTRAIDLSVASNLALSGMIAALFNRSFPEAGVAAAVALSCASGTVLGAFNGLLIWRLRLPPIVVTLGTLSIYRGLIYVISRGTWVNSSDMSPAFLGVVRERFLGLTYLSWLAIVCSVAFWALLRHTIFGRRLFASGGNPTAAAYIGIDAGRMQFFAFTLSGALAGICGFLWVSRFAVAYTDVALGYELQVIAACLIGGVSIAGGVGTVFGVVAGCLFLGVIRSALPLVGISPFWQMAVNGLVICAAAIVNARSDRLGRRQAILETVDHERRPEGN
jgi:rhamnose transport system permease protein